MGFLLLINLKFNIMVKEKIITFLRYLFGITITVIAFIMLLDIYEVCVNEVNSIYKSIVGGAIGIYWALDLLFNLLRYERK